MGGSEEEALLFLGKILPLLISKWHILVYSVVLGSGTFSIATKSCKNHTLNARGTRADMTKKNKHRLLLFLTLATNTNQPNPAVFPLVMCSRDQYGD